MNKTQGKKEESKWMLDKGMHASVSLRKLEPRKLQAHNSREEQSTVTEAVLQSCVL